MGNGLWCKTRGRSGGEKEILCLQRQSGSHGTGCTITLRQSQRDKKLKICILDLILIPNLQHSWDTTHFNTSLPPHPSLHYQAILPSEFSSTQKITILSKMATNNNCNIIFRNLKVREIFLQQKYKKRIIFFQFILWYRDNKSIFTIQLKSHKTVLQTYWLEFKMAKDFHY